MVRQNHVVFGRRGAGKSSLVESVCTPAAHIAIRMNLEDYKDISFPNILVHVLKASCRELDKAVRARSKWAQFYAAWHFRKELAARERELSTLLYEPDREDQQVRTKEDHANSVGASVATSESLTASISKRQATQREVSRTIPVDKLSKLQIELPHFKTLFREASRLSGDSPIFLVLDDFYFIPKAVMAHRKWCPEHSGPSGVLR